MFYHHKEFVSHRCILAIIWSVNYVFVLLMQTYNHEVHFDRHIVLHIQQKPHRMFSCHIYQMTCNSGKDDNIQKGKRRGCVWSKTGGRYWIFLDFTLIWRLCCGQYLKTCKSLFMQCNSSNCYSLNKCNSFLTASQPLG